MKIFLVIIFVIHVTWLSASELDGDRPEMFAWRASDNATQESKNRTRQEYDLNGLEKFLTQLETRLGAMEGKTSSLTSKTNTLTSKTSSLESQMSSVRSKTSTLEGKVAKIGIYRCESGRSKDFKNGETSYTMYFSRSFSYTPTFVAAYVRAGPTSINVYYSVHTNYVKFTMGSLSKDEIYAFSWMACGH